MGTARVAGRSRIVVVLAALACLAAATSASATPVQPNLFSESVVFSGLTSPTAIRFASDGRIFVAEKGGRIKEFDSPSDTTPTVVADLGTEVDNYWDRGLLGLALDPNFPTSPYVYALYTYDAAIGATAPRWNDACPSPPGPTTDGCVVSGRLVRLTLSGNVSTAQTVLIKDQWCQQYPSHSIGDLRFGQDGRLYASSGDGASFDFADYGQGGGGAGSPTPKNPCGDPPGGVGGTMTPPTARGGALRSQSVRRPTGDPVLLNGAVLRVDPATGNALPDNPLASNPDANAKRIVAYGFRNPFRFTIRPGTNELWIGDVGWNNWEEIDRLATPTAAALNFGWPCYEGMGTQPGYQGAGLSLCSSLTAGMVTAPYYTYSHGAAVVSGDNCPTGGGSSITGLAFYNGGMYPTSYNGALFFADYSRKCIWYMAAGTNGLPDPAQIHPFIVPAAGPVDLEIGPNGDLFYVDLDGGTVRRITYIGGNSPPVAVASANPTSGSVPLTVRFDGSGSSDPDAGDTISYSWDLNGDGTFGDSTAVSPSFTYSSAATYSVRLRVTDSHGASTVSAPVSISALSGGTSTFGTTVPGSSVDSATANYKEVSQYTAPQAGNVLKLTGYVSGLGAGSGSQPVRAVIYANAGGAPGALLGVSNPVTVTAGQPWGWVDFTFPSPVAVGAGLVWLGYIAGTTNDLTQLRYDPSPGELRYNTNPGGYAAGPSNPFGSTISSIMHYSLYATYTTGQSNSPPVPTISAPASSLTWKVGDPINFSGAATDPQDGALPASKLTWTLVLHHCPDGVNCHLHTVQSWNGIASGSFNAPDHEYPSWIELQLTATDSQGLAATTSVTLQPRTVNLTFQSQPSGLQLAVGSFSGATPFTRTVIVGSANSISAPTPQSLGGSSYAFSAWSDGGAQTHNITAPATSTTYSATFTASADTQPPTVPSNLTATAASSSQINLSWTASTDNVGVNGYRVERCQGAGCSNFAQVGTPAGTTFNNTGLTAGTSYSYRVRAADAAGNLSGYSNVASATTQAAGSALVASYSFNAGSGTTVADGSGNGNTGTIGTATWTTAGKYGNALAFNGTTARVTVNDSASLHLTAGMTLEAWVNPQTVSSAWRDVIYKGNDNYYLEATSDRGGNVPGAGGTFGTALGSAALAANAWSFLAVTYDRSTIRLYVNGTQVGSLAASGAIATSTNPLQIGGDAIYGQYFRGTIDEVRVYNVARTQAQIQTDMNTPL
jgi:PKD repeat protein/glucose/arabinose dehydrogenase